LRMSQMVCLSASLNRLTAEPPARRRHCSPIRPVLQRPPEDAPDRGMPLDGGNAALHPKR
jgi:hypothetical protein